MLNYNKKYFFFSGPWELEIATNVIIFERAPSMLSQPHPDIESYRGHLVSKLRQCYQELCQSRESRNFVIFLWNFTILKLTFFFDQILMHQENHSIVGSLNEK